MTDLSVLSMQEHEQSLIDAISKLTDISDGESGIFFFFSIFCHQFIVKHTSTRVNTSFFVKTNIDAVTANDYSCRILRKLNGLTLNIITREHMRN